MKVEWSADALDDLSRFAEFLHRDYPALAKVVAQEIISKSNVLAEQPLLGRPIGGHEAFRQIVLRILNAAYVLQYRYDGQRLVILRVFHGREARPPQ
jgi:addiction module RelE/StbE family toxin